jgi:hypothetical protein
MPGVVDSLNANSQMTLHAHGHKDSRAIYQIRSNQTIEFRAGFAPVARGKRPRALIA